MTTTQLNLRSLHLVPGLEADFDDQLRQLVQDCQKRPAHSKARKLKLELTIEPHPNDPDDVTIRPDVSSRRPSTAVDAIRARVAKNGNLQFDFFDFAEEDM